MSFGGLGSLRSIEALLDFFCCFLCASSPMQVSKTFKRHPFASLSRTVKIVGSGVVVVVLACWGAGCLTGCFAQEGDLQRR